MSRTGRVRRAACVGGAAVVGAFLLAVPAARAVSGVATGWWWSGQSSSLDPKLAVPPGGLWVAADPSGTQAVSAVRLQLDPGESSPKLTLTVHQSGGQGGSPAVVACPAASPWQPAEGGAWAARPQGDCSRVSAPGQPSSDGHQIAFDLSRLVAQGGVVDVVLLPQALAASAGSSVALPSGVSGPSSTVDVTFERVDPSAVATTTSAPAGAPAGSGAPVPAPTDTTPTTAFSNALQQQASPFEAAAPPGVPAEPAPATAAPPPAGPAAGFPRTGSSAPQPAAGPAAAQLTRAERAILDVALIFLLAGALGEPVTALVPAAASAVRRRLTLYDDPTLPEPGDAPRRHRAGSPPPLR